MSLLENLRRKGRGQFQGRPTRRPGGARRQYLIEELEPRVVLSELVSGTADANTILIRRNPDNPAEIRVRVATGNVENQKVNLVLDPGETLTINAGDGNDVIHVYDTFPDVFLVVNGQGDHDTLIVSPAARNLDTIEGDVTFVGGDGFDTLKVRDQNNTTSQPYTVTDASVDRDGSATIDYDTIEALNLSGGGTANAAIAYDIESTATGVTTTITGGVGNDHFKLSPSAKHFTDIDGNLNVSGGGGTNKLTIYDSSNLGLATYVVTSSTVARSGSATVSYSSLSGFSPLNLYGAIGNSLGAVTYNVESTAPGITATIYANVNRNTLNVTPTARNLDDLEGDVSFVDGGGTNTIVVNDQANTRSDPFTLSSSSLSRANWSARILSTALNVNRTIYAGPGNNTLTVTQPLSGTQTFDGGGGSDTLAAPNLTNTFNVTGANRGRLGVLNFSSTENLRGHSQSDTFVFGASGSLSGIVDGRGGVDAIDYSARSGAVRVNLLARTATSTGGISGVENATGGGGNDILIGDGLANLLRGNGGHDILVGNGGSDTIRGNNGRDLIIGGTGSDDLSGGGDDDIVIGCETDHDGDLVALQAIRAEWTAASDYDVRVDNLRNGGGLNGTYKLRSSGNDKSVRDDLVSDTLTGGPGQDWFFTDPPDPAVTRDPGEQIN
jgi:hypothetical protein